MTKLGFIAAAGVLAAASAGSAGYFSYDAGGIAGFDAGWAASRALECGAQAPLTWDTWRSDGQDIEACPIHDPGEPLRKSRARRFHRRTES